MLETFKTWITSMLCIGIFVTFLQLIIPKTSLKKYIYSLIGIITLLTIISPIVDLMKNDYVNQGVRQVIASLSDDTEGYTSNDADYKNITKNAVKKDMISKIKEDVTLKLKEQDIDVKDIYINLDENYNISVIEINIKKINTKISNIMNANSVIDYIHKEYGIEYSNISVVEE